MILICRNCGKQCASTDQLAEHVFNEARFMYFLKHSKVYQPVPNLIGRN